LDEVISGGSIKDGGTGMIDMNEFDDDMSPLRKRIVIDITLGYLHGVQEMMIEEALSMSDMAESKTVIEHIRGLK
jgi:hypothetical protein